MNARQGVKSNFSMVPSKESPLRPPTLPLRPPVRTLTILSSSWPAPVFAVCQALYTARPTGMSCFELNRGLHLATNSEKGKSPTPSMRILSPHKEVHLRHYISDTAPTGPLCRGFVGGIYSNRPRTRYHILVLSPKRLDSLFASHDGQVSYMPNS